MFDYILTIKKKEKQMITSSIFVVLVISAIISIILLAIGFMSDQTDITYVGILFGLIVYAIGIVISIDVFTGNIQICETRRLNELLDKKQIKCFDVDGELTCGEFTVDTDKYRYVSDGNKLTVYAK